MSRQTQTLIMVFAILSSLAPAKAATPYERGVAETLDIGWAKSYSAVSPAEAKYRETRALADDPRACYALALVLIKHRRYKQVGPILDEALKLDRGYLPAWRGKIWVLMLTKRYEVALVEMDNLSQQIAANAGADKAASTMVGFLGRVFGYLEGPAKKSVEARLVAMCKDRITSRLAQGLREVFDEGRKEVDQRYTELYFSHEQSKEDAEAKERKNRQEEADFLARRREAIAGDRQEINQQGDSARKQLDADVAALDKRLATLDQSLARLAAQAVPIAQQMQGIDREISRVIALADNTDDLPLRQRYALEIDRLTVLYGRYERDYQLVNARAAQVNVQRNTILGQRKAAVERYSAETKRLEKENASLRRGERRIEKELEQNQRPVVGNTPSVRALSAQVMAFTTYEPFPLEQEKHRLLQSFAR